MASRSVLDMNGEEAKKFFLEPESYFTESLPEYFDIEKILVEANSKLGKSDIKEIMVSMPSQKRKGIDKKRPLCSRIKVFMDTLNTLLETLVEKKPQEAQPQRLRDIPDVNIKIMVNKDSSYTWRPLTMIHPIIYVDLVNTITKDENWKEILKRFKEFKEKDERIICSSIPVKSEEKDSNALKQILGWWKNIEQEQIKLALEFDYCIHTDITDCYSSIYTHSIPWALHGKESEKANMANRKKKNKKIGNHIDEKIQQLQYGQTNGIPQGSVLMDFVAEIVLGYADYILSEKIKEAQLSDFKILRYRDDYRIFANKKDVVEQIMKLLTEVLLDLNFKINSKKTFLCKDIIWDGIKEDKVYWNTKNAVLISEKKITLDKKSYVIQYSLNRQKHLLEIKKLGDLFPNCGQLKIALGEFYKNRIKDLDKTKGKVEDAIQLISITTSIMLKNPGTIQYCVAIIHKLLEFIEDNEKNNVIDLILKKYEKLPNADFVEIWIQNISINTNPNMKYKHILCRKATSKHITLWNSVWLKNNKKLNELCFINTEKMKEEQPIYNFRIRKYP